MNERIIALDIGDVRIGVAVSDPTRTIATPVEVITRVGWGPDTRRILEICNRYDTVQVLSGLPLNMDGTEGFQAEKVRALCSQLEKAGLNVFFQDERLSTVSAEEALLEDGMSREGRKTVVDKVAAALILQQWLDAQQQKQQEEKNMSDDQNRMNPEDNEDVIELIDEEGNSTLYEHVATLEYEGETYLALCDPEADEDAENLEIFILKIEQDENGDDIYTVPDDDISDAVFEELLKLSEEMDDE